MRIRKSTNQKACLVAAVLCCYAGLSVQAQASDALGHCNIVLTSATDLPATEKKLLANSGDEAARICTDESGNLTEYAQVSPIWQRLGVCEFEIMQNSAVTYSMKMPVIEPSKHAFGQGRILMMPGRDRCPDQDDKRYVGVAGVSEGLFLSFVAFWNRLSSSPENFDAGFVVSKGELERSKDFQSLRSQLFSDHLLFHVTGIELMPKFVSMQVSGYKLSLQNERQSGEEWDLFVDLTPNGFRVLRFNRTGP